MNKLNRKIRIALVDDHLLFREGLKDLLSDQPDFEVVAEGGDGAEALGIMADHQVDVLLMDLRLPKLGGVPAIRRIRETHKDVKIIVISMFEDSDHHREAVLAGADAYHSKMDAAGIIAKTIRRLVKGEKIISARDLLQMREAQTVRDESSETSALLTDTEHQVLDHLCRGLTNNELARSMAMSERTLKNHLNSIFKKLGAKSRLEAVWRGLAKKLVSIEVEGPL